MHVVNEAIGETVQVGINYYGVINCLQYTRLNVQDISISMIELKFQLQWAIDLPTSMIYIS